MKGITKAGLVITYICAASMLLSVIFLLIALVVRRRARVDAERQLLLSPTPMPSGAAMNLTVSDKNRQVLLDEIRSDELLVWGHEAVSNRRAISALGSSILMAFISGVLSAFISLGTIFDTYSVEAFIFLVLTYLVWIVAFITGSWRIFNAETRLYGITSKRVFVLVSSPTFNASREISVRSSDYEGLQQMTETRKQDGSGTITFSLNLAGAHPPKKTQHWNPFAFENVPDVVGVKNLIENYKSAAKQTTSCQ